MGIGNYLSIRSHEECRSSAGPCGGGGQARQTRHGDATGVCRGWKRAFPVPGIGSARRLVSRTSVRLRAAPLMDE
jgi:hypothetical protein